MKTTTKVTKETKTETKGGNQLIEAFALWIHDSKAGIKYLTGNLSEKLGSGKLVGYFNTNKKNPKEPDIRVYSIDAEGNQDKEIADLWDNISINENEYLTGTSDEQERLIGFYDKASPEKLKRPYIRVYFKN